MAKRFSISFERKHDVLHLNLGGAFDRTCARQVVDLLAQSNNGIRKICIDTSLLEHPNPLELILAEWSSPEFSMIGPNETASEEPSLPSSDPEKPPARPRP